MLLPLSGMAQEAGAELAAFPARLLETREQVLRELTLRSCLRDGARFVPALPPAFAEVLALAIACEQRWGTAGQADLLRRHYLEFMPRLCLEQRLTREEPAQALFHTPLDWDRLPLLASVLQRPGVAPAGTASTLADLYGAAYYGGFMPLLNCYPLDLQLMAAALRESSLSEVIDHYLAPSLAHELSHGPRGRRLLVHPYLDECIAGHLGVRALRELAYPEAERPCRAIYATPWLAQVGQALCRVAGTENVERAQAGVLPWEQALPAGLCEALAALAWEELRRRRDPHFLSSTYHPSPWMKLFFLAAAGALPVGPTLAHLEALPFAAIPAGTETAADEEILRDALCAMCLRPRPGPVLLVDMQPPAAPIDIDLFECRVVTAADGMAPAPLSYLFPPATAARLRSRGIAGYTLELRTLAALPAVTAAVRDGAGTREGAGYALICRSA